MENICLPCAFPFTKDLLTVGGSEGIEALFWDPPCGEEGALEEGRDDLSGPAWLWDTECGPKFAQVRWPQWTPAPHPV